MCGGLKVFLYHSRPKQEIEVLEHLHAQQALPPGKESQVRIQYEAAWAPETMSKLRRRENVFLLPDMEP
jgi:hypothetical protein